MRIQTDFSRVEFLVLNFEFLVQIQNQEFKT